MSKYIGMELVVDIPENSTWHWSWQEWNNYTLAGHMYMYILFVFLVMRFMTELMLMLSKGNLNNLRYNWHDIHILFIFSRLIERLLLKHLIVYQISSDWSTPQLDLDETKTLQST